MTRMVYCPYCDGGSYEVQECCKEPRYSGLSSPECCCEPNITYYTCDFCEGAGEITEEQFMFQKLAHGGLIHNRPYYVGEESTNIKDILPCRLFMK